FDPPSRRSYACTSYLSHLIHGADGLRSILPATAWSALVTSLIALFLVQAYWGFA
ncbi:Hypothetical protein FKW44_002550, partial [Caligus rogercresseyi]